LSEAQHSAYKAWLSKIDSDRFGIRVVRAENVTASDTGALASFCDSQKADLAIARCSASDLEAARLLQEAGFAFVDGEIRYSHEIATLEMSAISSTSIRRAAAADTPAILALARTAFHDHAGHYHADPRLDRETVRAAYADWAERCASGTAADVVLVVAEPHVKGFAAFARRGHEAQLVLGCVAPAEAGRGLYAELTRAGIRWAREIGASSFFAITQLANTAAQRSWAHTGLLPSGGAYTFHRWFA
jgi:GNAT superfamily N-acetyltransferase